MEETKKKETIFREAKICPVCGKEVFPTIYWVYKDTGGWYCSWTCYRKSPHKKYDADFDGVTQEYDPNFGGEKVVKKRNSHLYKEIEQLTLDGELVATHRYSVDAMNAVGAKCEESVREACRTGKKYKGYLWRYKNG